MPELEVVVIRSELREWIDAHVEACHTEEDYSPLTDEEFDEMIKASQQPTFSKLAVQYNNQYEH